MHVGAGCATVDGKAAVEMAAIQSAQTTASLGWLDGQFN